MIRLRHKLLIHGLRFIDQAVLVVSLFTILELISRRAGSMHIREIVTGTYGARDSLATILILVGWIVTCSSVVRYETDRLKTLASQVRDVMKSMAICAFWLVIVSAAFGFTRINKEVIALFWCLSTVICLLVRLMVRWLLMVARRNGYNYRHVLILGADEHALNVARRIDSNPVLGYKIVGFVAERPEEATGTEATGHPVVGTFSDLKRILENGPVDEMIICAPAPQLLPQVCEAVKLSEQLGIVVRIFPEGGQSRIFRRLHVERFEGDYVITMFREQMVFQLFVKRLLDFFGALALITVLSPLLLVVALVIKFTTRGPVFFVQERVGMNKRRFKLYKFRSMYVDAEKRRRELEHLNEMDGPVFKIKNDPRITPIGRFIRKTSIDELPQLVNVLRGQMSMVGPRPPLPSEVDQYEWLYRKRLSIKPGITCLWQISGRNHISFQQWMEMDREYIDTWSVWLDIQILARTVPTVLFGRGAS